MPEDKKDYLQLPTAVVSRVDIGRLLREVEALHNFLNQSAVRQPGTPVKLPKTSRLMDEIVTVNKLNVLQTEERDRLYNFLKEVRDSAPILHMSFNSDPAPLFMQKLTTWLRGEIHPLVLLQIGMQPNIGAGCIVRTTNKYFDFSLKQHFDKHKDILKQKLVGTPVPTAHAILESVEKTVSDSPNATTETTQEASQ